MPADDTPLKLIVLDAEDLSVVSAHLQDAVLKRADMVYLPGQRRFALAARRFDWQAAQAGQKRRAPAPRPAASICAVTSARL